MYNYTEKEVYCENCERVTIFWFDTSAKIWRCSGDGGENNDTGECLNSYSSIGEEE